MVGFLAEQKSSRAGGEGMGSQPSLRFSFKIPLLVCFYLTCNPCNLHRLSCHAYIRHSVILSDRLPAFLTLTRTKTENPFFRLVDKG